MPLIPCPWCGPRDAAEFRGDGAAQIPRDGDAAWADYLYLRDNPAGAVAERWLHRTGCGRRFDVLRDTASHRIVAVYKTGDRPPAAGEFAGDP